MAYKITNVNGDRGPNIVLQTTQIPEGSNLYFTEQRCFDASILNRTQNPTYLDKHFYTIGALEQKVGDLYWHIINPIKIVQVFAKVKIPSAGNSIALYVQKNGGNSPDKLLYDITINPGALSATAGGDKILQPGDYIQIDVASIGTVSPGADLTLSFKYHNILS